MLTRFVLDEGVKKFNCSQIVHYSKPRPDNNNENSLLVSSQESTQYFPPTEIEAGHKRGVE